MVSSCATALEQRDCLVIKRTNSSDRQLKLPDLRTTTTRTVYSVRTVSKVNIFRFGIKLHTRGRLYRISIFTIQIALTPKVCYSNRFFRANKFRCIFHAVTQHKIWNYWCTGPGVVWLTWNLINSLCLFPCSLAYIHKTLQNWPNNFLSHFLTGPDNADAIYSRKRKRGADAICLIIFPLLKIITRVRWTPPDRDKSGDNRCGTLHEKHRNFISPGALYRKR